MGNLIKAAAATALALGAFTSVSAVAQQMVKVGIVQSTSGGSAAIYGTVQKNAAELAIEQINASGQLGNLKLEGMHADDAGDRGQTVNIFQRMLNRDKVAVIFGPSLSNSMFAAGPLAQQARTPVIASSNTASGIPAIGTYIFRTSPPESVTFPGVLQFAKEKYKIKTAAQIYGIDDVSMKANYEVHKAALQKEGIKVLTTETLQKGDVDYSAQLTKIKAANPDAIVISALAEEVANIVRQARQLGIPQATLLIASNSAISPKFIELAGPAGEGLLAGAGWFLDFDSPANKAFIKAYSAKFGSEPDSYAAYQYTAVLAFADALKRAGGAGDSAKLRDALAATKDIDSPLGKFSFTSDREPVIQAKVLVVKAAKFVIAE
ncbi:ABC transporter substrate-binding protein [Reyranella sp.]|uniref:ABC transporter substrate-binding protein n=1 Tax=Reyranella sp. TaxID=1929291 RepID=UPI003D102BD8